MTLEFLQATTVYPGCSRTCLTCMDRGKSSDSFRSMTTVILSVWIINNIYCYTPTKVFLISRFVLLWDLSITLSYCLTKPWKKMLDEKGLTEQRGKSVLGCSLCNSNCSTVLWKEWVWVWNTITSGPIKFWTLPVIMSKNTLTADRKSSHHIGVKPRI